MTSMRTTAPVVLAIALMAGACKDAPAPTAAAPPRSELAELATQAEAFANRADGFVARPWASRLEFQKRLHVRKEAALAYVRDAAAATAETQAALVERGRAFMLQGRPFEQALALLDRLARSIEEISGYQRLIGIHMKLLETQGEAPFRLRVDHLDSDARVGFKHLDEALSRMIVLAPDAETHEKIATGTMRRVLDTATKLAGEIKVASQHASATEARSELLQKRVAWADQIVEKAGTAVSAEAKAALEEARKFSSAEIGPRKTVVLDKLRNAQADAGALAEALAKDIDLQLERVTKSFLDLGRKAGVSDPK